MTKFGKFGLFLAFYLLSPAYGAPCTPETPVIEVDGRYVNCSYFNYVLSTIPEWALKRYYSGKDGLEKLEDKLAERQLILEDYLKKGFFKRPDVENEVRRTEIKTLSSLYMARKLKNIKVSDEEIGEEIRRRYGSKEVTPELRHSVEVQLKVRKIVSKREEILNSVKSRLKILNENPRSPRDKVAEFDGKAIYLRDLEPLLPKKFSRRDLERALLNYSLYLSAKKEGLDSLPEYGNALLYRKEEIAVSDFERKIMSKISVSDGEIRNYYEKHKNEFKTPSSARVLILEFDSENEARRALTKLRAGENLREAVPKKVMKSLKEWTVLSSDRNNPVSQLVFSSKEKYNLLNVPSGKTLLIIVKRRKPSEYLPLGDVYYKIKEKLLRERAEREKDKVISRLKAKYGLRILRSPLCCREENSD